LMSPHRLAYGAAYDFPFAAVVAVATFVSLLLNRDPKRFPITPLTCVLMVFILWMSITGFTAFDPNKAWSEWSTIMKTLLMVLITIYTINTKQDLKKLVWVIVLSLGFYGFKGGIFTLSSGGTSHVLGPEGSYITDNNTLALALITTLPLIWYLQMHSEKKWLRLAFIGLTVLTIVAAIGSYSRGALLGGGAMLIFLWLKGRQKLLTGVAIAMTVLLAINVMPDKWFDRMSTIDNFNEDASALGRINAWHFAINVANDNFMGGGFKSFSPKMFLVYAPDPLDFHVAHSIYFQVLGDHGFIGLGIFLLLMFLAWRTGTRIKKWCHQKQDLAWAFDLATMCQVSIIGFSIGGAFLSLPYYDLYYCIVAVLVILEKIIVSRISTTNDLGVTASDVSNIAQRHAQDKTA